MIFIDLHNPIMLTYTANMLKLVLWYCIVTPVQVICVCFLMVTEKHNNGSYRTVERMPHNTNYYLMCRI